MDHMQDRTAYNPKWSYAGLYKLFMCTAGMEFFGGFEETQLGNCDCDGRVCG